MSKHWSIESEYNEQLEALRVWEEIEKERPLNRWEESEKREVLWNLDYYGDLLREEEEENRRQICESQGLSRWC